MVGFDRSRAVTAGFSAVGGKLGRSLALGALVVAVVATSAAAGRTPSNQAGGVGPAAAGSAYRDGRLLVSFDASVSPSSQRTRVDAIGGHVLKTFLGGTQLLAVPNGSVTSALKSLRGGGGTRFAEPDYLMSESGATVPNDPSFGLQWAFRNTGQSVNGITGSAGADERATAAWSVSTGSRSIVIAEVDTGVDYNHPDLAANIWSNPGGINGCDAGTHGYNVLTSLCDPMDDETTFGGHGTHVAGILGAVGNNGAGVSGVNWAATILPVKWLDSAGNGSTSGLLSALDWVLKAKQAGVNVRVVNDSATFIGTSFSQALSDEIDLLGQNDILFVTAAGNTGDNNDDLSVRRYPCGFDRPTEICVTASNQHDELPSWANYGATTVDLAAPGDNIYSTLRNGTYGYISGGSMASPQVAGAAALILSTGSMSATALKADILDNVDPVPALSGLVRTGGRLNICKALPGCATAVAAPVNTGLPVVSGSAVQGQVLSSSTGTWSNAPTGFAYQWLRCGGGSCVAIGGAVSSSYTVVSGDVGDTLEARVTASNAGGSTAATSAATATVQAAGSSEATFGTSTVGAGSDTMLADRKRVNRYQLPVAGTVSKLSIYLQPTNKSGTQVLKGVLYGDSSGSPGALLGVSSQLSFSSTQSAGWYDLVFPSPLSLDAGSYWIGMISGPTSGVAGFRYASVSGSRSYNSNSYSSGPTNPFGTVKVDNEQMSEYATYTPASTATDTSAPSQPTGVTSTASGDTRTRLSWSASADNTGVAGYVIRRNGAVVTRTGTDATHFVDSFLAPGASYTYTVQAYDAAGNDSPESSPSAVSTFASANVQRYEYVFPANEIDVYDMDDGQKLVKTISLPQARDIRGAAADPVTHILYVSYGGDGGANGNGSMLAYDLVSDTVTWTKAYATGVDSMAISADGTRIYMPTGEAASGSTWNVIDAANGDVLSTIVGGSGPHNTIVSLDGGTVFLGGRTASTLIATRSDNGGLLSSIGPLGPPSDRGVRPFTINGKATLAFSTASSYLGFQVSDVKTGDVLYTVPITGAFPYTAGQAGPSSPSHGISLSPDEKELWVIDEPNSYVHVFDVSGLPSVAPTQIADIPLAPMVGTQVGCSYDCLREGWLQHSLDGRYVFVGDSGDVIDTSSRKSVANLTGLVNSRVELEIDWSGGLPIATSSRSGLGYVTN
jgi:subtilisin family serine protease